MMNLIAPWSCVFCGFRTAGAERAICRGCLGDLPWNEPVLSPTPGPFQCLAAMLRYEFPVDAAIRLLKFSRRLYYAPAFAEILNKALPLLPQDIDGVLPVPLHWRRQALRGFNQAHEIAKPLARSMGVELVKGVSRKRATPYQSGLRAIERAKNLRRAFVVNKPLDRRHVLIVDDVVTTGATGQRVASVLRRAGVPRVSFLALAVAP